MKFKSFFFAAIAAVFSFASCDEMGGDQNLGTPEITVSATELAFEEAGGDKSLTLNATRDWKVTSTADWVVVTPASGKASADDQTVTVSATENTGGNRVATLTFTIGMVSKTVQVSQVGTGVTPNEGGDGTEASPYSASQAFAVTSQMEKDVVGTNAVYVKGKVAQIKEAYSSQYGNVSFYITDDGVAANDAKEMFLVYRCKYFGNVNFSSADQLKVGDDVVVTGNLLNYYGNTPELKNSYVVKINGETSGSTVTPPAGGEDTPSSGPIDATAADFDGLESNSSYSTLTTPDGWVLTNCAIQKYGTSTTKNDEQPFLPEGVRAVCMNGKTTAVGTIVSPVITGGCGVLSFSYAAAFSEGNGISFKVEVLQNDEVVKTFDVKKTDSVIDTAYSHEETIDVVGNFSLKFTNNSPSNNSSANKDRYSIWGITWTGKVAE